MGGSSRLKKRWCIHQLLWWWCLHCVAAGASASLEPWLRHDGRLRRLARWLQWALRRGDSWRCPPGTGLLLSPASGTCLWTLDGSTEYSGSAPSAPKVSEAVLAPGGGSSQPVEVRPSKRRLPGVHAGGCVRVAVRDGCETGQRGLTALTSLGARRRGWALI